MEITYYVLACLLQSLTDEKKLKLAYIERLKLYREYIAKGGTDTFDNSTLATRRYMVSKVLQFDTILHVSLWKLAIQVRIAIVNPRDTGAKGKIAEVVERLQTMKRNGTTETTWSEFFAHSQNVADIIDEATGTTIESKTGVAGADFLRSESSDFCKAVEEYRHLEELLHFHNKEYEFDILCTWSEFFDYLSAYNNKGLNTWFDTVPSKRSGKLYIYKMQVIKTSKKKIKYLQSFDSWQDTDE